MQGRSPEEAQRDGLPENSSYSVQTNSCPHALLLSPNITMKCKNEEQTFLLSVVDTQQLHTTSCNSVNGA